MATSVASKEPDGADQVLTQVISTTQKGRASLVKNKLRRQLLYRKERLRKARERRDRKEIRKREVEQLGEEAPPKQKPHTIENSRVVDETIVCGSDEEVLHDMEDDEMSEYFRGLTTPKVLIISVSRPSRRTHMFMRELSNIVPNSEIRSRRNVGLKKIIPIAIGYGYTDIVVVNQDRRMPNAILLCHLPDGPTAHFKLTGYKPVKRIRRHAHSTSCNPEVVLNNFTTRVGHMIARMLAALFPHNPQFTARKVVTFHNQRDFIFFRQHRYMFKNSAKVGLQEAGPRFTLKLRSLQHGTFDSTTGEYIWVHNRKQMDTNRRKFHL